VLAWAVRGRSAKKPAYRPPALGGPAHHSTPAPELSLALPGVPQHLPDSNHNSIGETGFEPATARPPAGVPLRTVQHWMGHADSKTTQIYAHYQPAENEAEIVDRAFAPPA
jgi:hypothetical protein